MAATIPDACLAELRASAMCCLEAADDRRDHRRPRLSPTGSALPMDDLEARRRRRLVEEP
jgi:hypothetical protein